MTKETSTVRHAARVVMLDETNRILLIKFEANRRGAQWWATPGGSLEGNETHESAARREVKEETGFDLKNIGPWIWTRKHVFRFGGCLYSQHERFFVANVYTFNPQPTDLEAEELEELRDMRWWSLEELEVTMEELSPEALPSLVRRLIEYGPPKHPIRVGV